MIVNFMCQLNWATGCPDSIWFLGVSMRMLLDELTFEVVHSVKQMVFLSVGGGHPPIPEGFEENKKVRKESTPFSYFLTAWDETSHLIFCCAWPGVYSIGSVRSQVFRFGLEVQFSWISGLQMENCRTLSPAQLWKSTPHNKLSDG